MKDKMKTIDNQKEVALKVLRKLEMFDPTCILAGGAPRVWYFENIANDLDFYVHFRPDLQSFFRESQLERVGLKGFRQKGSDESDFPESYKRNPYLLCVYEGKVSGEKVQIMFMKEPTFHSVVNLFPFGICQAWWKGDKVETSNEFDLSVKHRVLKITNNLYSDADGYIEKIRNKFPDYLFIR